MPKVLLINPPTEGLVGKNTKKFHRRFPPLELLLSATLLREIGWEVELHDLNADPNKTVEQSILSAKSADYVVCTTNPYADWQCPSFAISTALNLAQKFPGDKLIIIGNHGSHYPGSLIRNTGAKVVIRNEPEFTLLEMAKNFNQSLAAQDLSNILGISYRKENGENVHNQKRDLGKVDELPFPAYDLVKVENYYYELLGSNFALLEASRGCPFSCNFCNLSMFQNSYRKSSIDRFLEQIDKLILEHGCRSLYIFDLEFTINKKMVKAVCEHIIKKNYVKDYGFRWACQTRADTIQKGELLDAMRDSGCKLIHFGVEAGNKQILENTNKRIDKENIKIGIKATKDAGIKAAAFFIFGHPQETEANYQETLDFALELSPDYASFHPLLPFPGSPLFEEKFGKSPYWEEDIKLDLTYFTKEQQNVLNKFVRKAYLRFYLRPTYLLSQIFHGDFDLYLRQFNLFKAFVLSK
ncbi:MAG: radical SAM protein [Proteobacteria bacterium]|nr:radical SAM protein [Pseudomonadota bacterium]